MLKLQHPFEDPGDALPRGAKSMLGLPPPLKCILSCSTITVIPRCLEWDVTCATVGVKVADIAPKSELVFYLLRASLGSKGTRQSRNGFCPASVGTVPWWRPFQWCEALRRAGGLKSEV